MTTKLIILLLFILTILTNCQDNNPIRIDKPKELGLITLSEKEIFLCDSLKFDKELALLIKTQTGNSLQLIPKIDSVTGEATKLYDKGICTLISNKYNDYDFALNNKSKFKEKGYLVFVHNHDWDGKEYLTIMKGSDEIEIISWRKTSGVNHGHQSQEVVDRFKKWQTSNDFWVIAVGRDLVYINFKEQIETPEKFAKEMYDFCPDAIEQGAGDMKTLIQATREMNGAYFWWD